MKNDKTPGSDGQFKEFYEIFWNDVKTPLLATTNDPFIKTDLSASQKQVIITLIPKRQATDSLKTGDQYPY